MLIKTKLRLLSLLPAVFALLIGSILWGSTVNVDKAHRNSELAETVLRYNFELNILTQEYLLYGGARSEKQLRIRHRSMGELLASFPGDTAQERELIASIQLSHQELSSFYDLLLNSNVAAREQIIGALLVKSQAIRAKSRQLADFEHLAVLSLQRHADIIVMVSIITLTGLSILLLALTTRRVVRSIGLLKEGMQQISGGDLEHRISVDTDDELGALTQAFNSMTGQLRDSYTSIDKLTAEIDARQEAEQEIRKLNIELEERVHRRTAELEVANKELEAFAYSVSHDLRAPLRAVDGFSRKVVAGYGDKLDAEGRRQLQVVRENAQRMGQLIDDLLAFSRMGRREMASQKLDMEALSKGVVNELRMADPERVIEFSFTALPSALGDAAMLRQVWVNLIGNAIKFTRERPVAHIEIGGSTEGGEVVYWVKDDGAGFDMQYADKLFGVFQRLHRQDEFEGTGVGLAIAQRILHRHNGRIWGEGKPNLGATFRFALPIA